MKFRKAGTRDRGDNDMDKWENNDPIMLRIDARFTPMHQIDASPSSEPCRLPADRGGMGGGEDNINSDEIDNAIKLVENKKHDSYSNEWTIDQILKSYYDENFLYPNPNREKIFTYCLLVNEFPYWGQPAHITETDEFVYTPFEYHPSTYPLTAKYDNDYHRRYFSISIDKSGDRFLDDFIYQVLNHSGPKTGDVDQDDDYLNDWAEAYYGTDPYNPDGDGDGILDGHDKEPFNYNRRFAFIIEQDEDGDVDDDDDLGEVGYACAKNFKDIGFDFISFITNIDYPDEWRDELEGVYYTMWPSCSLFITLSLRVSVEASKIIDKEDDYGEDIMAFIISGHGRYYHIHDDLNLLDYNGNDKGYSWQYKTACGWGPLFHVIRDWINMPSMDANLIGLFSCETNLLFDQWDEDDDCLVVGGEKGATYWIYAVDDIFEKCDYGNGVDYYGLDKGVSMEYAYTHLWHGTMTSSSIADYYDSDLHF